MSRGFLKPVTGATTVIRHEGVEEEKKIAFECIFNIMEE